MKPLLSIFLFVAIGFNVGCRLPTTNDLPHATCLKEIRRQKINLLG